MKRGPLFFWEGGVSRRVSPLRGGKVRIGCWSPTVPGKGKSIKEENDVFSKLRGKFIKDPTLYFAMSIAATWAGVGSLMNGITMAQDYGIVPFLIWALGNTLACIIFGAHR